MYSERIEEVLDMCIVSRKTVSEVGGFLVGKERAGGDCVINVDGKSFRKSAIIVTREHRTRTKLEGSFLERHRRLSILACQKV